MKKIDARGLACPAPVLKTRASLEEEAFESLKVIVDNAAAQQNVQRFLDSQGFRTTLEQKGADYLIIGSLISNSKELSRLSCEQNVSEEKIMIVCATDRMGFGDDELSCKLMINFLRTLKEMGRDLWRLVFLNNGVKLTIEDSEVLADLRDLEKSGIEILVCGTCLNHFNLFEKKQVGDTTNMLDIVTAMTLADKVISI